MCGRVTRRVVNCQGERSKEAFNKLPEKKIIYINIQTNLPVFVLCMTTDVASKCWIASGHRSYPIQKAFHAHVVAALKNNVLNIIQLHIAHNENQFSSRRLI